MPQIHNDQLVTNFPEFEDYFELIEEQVLAAPVKTVTFPLLGITPIPNKYRGLRFVILARSDDQQVTADSIRVNFNGDVGNNYRYRRSVFGATYTTNTGSGVAYALCGETSASNTTVGIFGCTLLHLPNYRDETTMKTIISHSVTSITSFSFAGVWTIASLEPIITIDFTLDSGENFIAGCTFALYGIY